MLPSVSTDSVCVYIAGIWLFLKLVTERESSYVYFNVKIVLRYLINNN